MKDLTSRYDQLKEAFSNGKAKIKETGGWRDDMKFFTSSHVSFVTSWRKMKSL